jgi:hypothetical protein
MNLPVTSRISSVAPWIAVRAMAKVRAAAALAAEGSRAAAARAAVRAAVNAALAAAARAATWVGGGSGVGGGGETHRLGWIFGTNPGDADSSEKRQNEETLIFDVAPCRVPERQNPQGRAGSECDCHLARLLLQPRLQFLFRYLSQPAAPPASASLRRMQHGRSAKIRQARRADRTKSIPASNLAASCKCLFGDIVSRTKMFHVKHLGIIRLTPSHFRARF